MGRIPIVKELLIKVLEGHELILGFAASQVISNVPAAVLLSTFTEDWKGLLVGTNVGGLGTLIASLASLISFKLYIRTEEAKPLRYLGLFTLANVIGLVVLGVVVWLLP